MAMKPTWPKLSRPVKPNWMFSPMAAMANTAASRLTPARSAFEMMSPQSMPPPQPIRSRCPKMP